MVQTIDEFFQGYQPLRRNVKQDETGTSLKTEQDNLYAAKEQEAKPSLYIGKEIRVTIDYDCDDGNICSE